MIQNVKYYVIVAISSGFNLEKFDNCGKKQ